MDDGCTLNQRSIWAEKKRIWRISNREKERKTLRKWVKNNPQKVKVNSRNNYLRHRQRFIAQAKRWNQAHPEKRSKIMIFQNAKRRSRLLSNGGRGFSRTQWDKLLKNTKGLCCYCRLKKANSIDHFYPVSRGGEHDWFNIVPACRRCNSLKGASDPLVWILTNFGNHGWNYAQLIKLAFD